MSLNWFTRHIWERWNRLSFKFSNFFDFPCLFIFLHLTVVIHKIRINSFRTSQLPWLFKFLQFFNLTQELFLLGSFYGMGFFGNVHVISHLHEMGLHYFVVAQFFVVIYFFAKLDDVGWVDSFFVIKVSNVSYTSKMFIWQLWIRVWTMEPIFNSAWFNRWSSTFLHRWSKNRQIPSFARIDRLPAVAGVISIGAEPTFCIVSALSIVSEGFPIYFIISGS